MATRNKYKGWPALVTPPTGTGGDLIQDAINLAADALGQVIESTADPTVNDDSTGTSGTVAHKWSKWHNTASGKWFISLDHTNTAAVWRETFSTASTGVFGGTMPSTNLTGLTDGFLHATTNRITHIKSNLASTVAPTSTDDSAAGWAVGSRWTDLATQTVYEAVAVTTGAAVWANLSAGAGGGATASSGLTDVTLTAATSGSLWYHNGSAWVDLPAGTTDQYLISGAAPAWVARPTTSAISPSSGNYADSAFNLFSTGSTDKVGRFDVNSVTSGTTAIITFPAGDLNLGGGTTDQYLIGGATPAWATRPTTGAGGGGGTTFEDTAFRVFDTGTTDKAGGFELSGVTSGTTVILTWPNAAGTIGVTTALLDSFVAPSTSGVLNATTLRPGLLPQLSGASTDIFLGSGVFGAVPATAPTTHASVHLAGGSDPLSLPSSDLSDVTITASTAGHMLYHNGTAWVNLTAGTTAQHLIGGTAPAWASHAAYITATSADTLQNKTIDGVDNTFKDVPVSFTARKGSAGTITKGTPVYVSGYNASGWVEVEEADADGAGTMPCVGLATESITNAADAQVITSGRLVGFDTSAFAVGNILYVSTTAGTLTATKPTGDTPIQSVCEVLRSHASLGVVLVLHSGRVNAIPNVLDMVDITASPDAAGEFQRNGTNLEFHDGTAARILYQQSGTDVAVADGGTGLSSATAYAVLCGGTTGTGAFQSIAGLGSSGEVLTSNGAGALPTFQAAGGSLPRGYIDGLTMANNGTDADHDIDISAGECRGRDDDEDITFSAQTKQIDATWASGTAAGGLSSSLTAPANNTWYHVFVGNVAGNPEAGFDTSVTGANLVTDHSFTAIRRIGSVLTNGTANIIAFVQVNDQFLWSVPVSDLDTTNPGTSAVLLALTVPAGVQVHPIGTFALTDATATLNNRTLLTSPDQADTTPTATLFTLATYNESGARSSAEVCLPLIWTNTSRQIRYRMENSDVGMVVREITQGWCDPRDRNV